MHLNAFEIQQGILEEMEMPSGFRLSGWVYVLSNEYMPGIYKVGMTTTSPETRAKELSSATGVPFPFKVESAYHCEDPARSEREIHEALQDVRINDSREFFQEELEDINGVCEEYCEALVGGRVEDLAMRYDVISFETLSSLNIPDLFEDIGISVLGDRLAIAERLIRLGAKFIIENLNKQGVSAVFHEDKGYTVMDSETSWVRREEAEIQAWEESKLAAGIYGPQLPPLVETVPF